MIRDIGNTNDFRTGYQLRYPSPHRQRHCAVRRPVSVGNPLHDIVVEPFELARHRGHRFDVEGALGRALVDDGRAERHHYGVRHTDDLARLGRTEAIAGS